MTAKSLHAIRIVPLLVCAAVASAQSESTECASLTNPAAAASVKASTGSADRQKTVGVAAQIQPRRAAVPRSTFSCRCGTVDAAALTAKSNSQEVVVLAAIPGSFRFNHVLLRESTPFDLPTEGTISVAMGRPAVGNDVSSPFTLGNAPPDNSWYERPGPPQLAGAYDLVLFFQASFPLGDGDTSNLKRGTVTWEVCGYNGAPSPAR